MRKEELDFSGKWKDAQIAGNRSQPTLYLFRHAQTYYNRKKYFTGWKDSKLTPLGKKQAELVARKLKGKKIDVAITSSLSRSKDTMRAVLKYHPECKAVFVDDRIIERSYGKLEGKSHRCFEKSHSKEELQKIRRGYDYPPPGGESIKMVEKRVLSFLEDLIAFMEKNKANVAISAHGNSMRPIRRYFEKLSVEEMMKLENPWDDYFEYKISQPHGKRR
ncbi:MAG: histidine phosphatase family protein [Candidatus Micrarchaeota archaeon]|nr:histidine phosphatase family protein [Candidatus Micrarchaeota archaeon]